MDLVKKWKEKWTYPTCLLCIYGFFSTVKPLEPFLIPYLTGPDKNLTIEQVANEIFPVWTYSYLAVSVPVFLLTDWLRYKPVVVFQCSALFVTTAMLLWLQGVGVMQAMEFAYGVVTACEVAYFSYIYSIVDIRYYLKATSYCRMAQLLGYTVGSVLGQLMVSFNLLSYYYILVLTIVLTSVALVTSILLPMPTTSMFFHPERGNVKKNEEEEHTGNHKTLETEQVKEETAKCFSSTEMGSKEGNMKHSQETPGMSLEENRMELSSNAETNETTPPGGCGGVLLQLWRDFLHCYSTREMLYWSVWWAMATCGYNQTVNYVQALWEQVQPSSNFTIYNGGVEAVSNLFGAAAAYGISFMSVDWSHWGELSLGSLSGLGAGSLFVMVFTANIWACYVAYIIFKSLYMLLITIAMYQIAVGLSVERYALVFGVNTFIALVLQTILTSIVVDIRGLGLHVIPQFIIYGTYFSCIAIIFILRGLYICGQRAAGSVDQSVMMVDEVSRSALLSTGFPHSSRSASQLCATRLF